MSDGLDLLVDDARLYRLLTHYQTSAGDDREVWLDRVSDWESGDADEVARWHGLLLASAWVEQNTGQTTPGCGGNANRCYRVTPAGRSALKKVASRRVEDDDVAA